MAGAPRGASGALLSAPSRSDPRGGPPLLVGQSLELWRARLRDALRRRDPLPLLARAERQLAAARAAGATSVALDLNLGAGLDADPERLAEDLAWSATAIRERHPGLPLWLDCGSQEGLAAALPKIAPPLVANASFCGRPGARELLAAVATAGAGVVVSPAARDEPAAPASLDELLRAAEDARAALAAAGLGEAWFDCLAYPAPAPPERALALVRTLAAEADTAPRLRPLLAAGNAGHGTHGTPGPLRDALRALYAAAAAGAGVAALLAPLEQPSLHDAVAVATRARPPRDPAERWLHAVATAAAAGDPPPPPDPALTATQPHLAEAWTRLFG